MPLPPWWQVCCGTALLRPGEGEVTAVDVPQLSVTHDKRLKIKPTLDNKLVNIVTSLVLL